MELLAFFELDTRGEERLGNLSFESEPALVPSVVVREEPLLDRLAWLSPAQGHD